MVTVTLTPDLEQVIVKCAEQHGTTPEIFVLDELRTRYLPVITTSNESKNNSLTLSERRAILKLPLSERRQLLAEQAERLISHYETDSEWRELQDGDIIEY